MVRILKKPQMPDSIGKICYCIMSLVNELQSFLDRNSFCSIFLTNYLPDMSFTEIETMMEDIEYPFVLILTDNLDQVITNLHETTLRQVFHVNLNSQAGVRQGLLHVSNS